MTEDTKPPPWPAYNNEEGKSLLADWVQDRIADAYDELYGAPELEGLLHSEKEMLIAAFGLKDWAKVAVRLRNPDATRAFVGVVAHLIELNAMTNRTSLLRDDDFSDAYTPLNRRDDILTARNWHAVLRVLLHDYPDMAGKGKGKEVEWMTVWLTAVLRGVEAGKKDTELFNDRHKYIKRMLKAGKDDRRNRLARLVHAVQTTVATDD
ncbi:hypothetical protein [Rhizobium sp. RCC_161_2]|uniref:hypothetical protein n=1 Tax=Rhizobium sp. RCC_161_2 TaxID=3239219 RepID=UPI0035239A0F